MTSNTVSEYVTSTCREYRNAKTVPMEYLNENCSSYKTTLLHVGMATHKINGNALKRSLDIIPKFMYADLLDDNGKNELESHMEEFNMFVDDLLKYMSLADNMNILNDEKVIDDYGVVMEQMEKLKSLVSSLEVADYNGIESEIENKVTMLFDSYKNEVCGINQHTFVADELKSVTDFINAVPDPQRKVTSKFKELFPEMIDAKKKAHIPSEELKTEITESFSGVSTFFNNMFNDSVTDVPNKLSGWISTKGEPASNKTLIVVMDPRFYHNDSAINNHNINMLILMELEKIISRLDVVFFPCFAHDLSSIKKYDLQLRLSSSIDDDITKNYFDGTLVRQQVSLLRSIADNRRSLIIINNMSTVSTDQSINIPKWLMSALVECDKIISSDNNESKLNMLTLLITRTGFVPSGFYVIHNKQKAANTLYTKVNNGTIKSVVNNETEFERFTQGSIGRVNYIFREDILMHIIDDSGLAISLNNSPENAEVDTDKEDAEEDKEDKGDKIMSGGNILDTLELLKESNKKLDLDNVTIKKAKRHKKKMILFDTSKYV